MLTTLTAKQDVNMPDVKDGMLGLRVAHELELPSKEKRQFTDDKGNVTTVDGNANKPLQSYITAKVKPATMCGLPAHNGVCYMES